MNLLNDKEKNRKNFVKTGRGRRQDHATRGTADERKDSDVSEWLQSAAHRRDERHGAGEVLAVQEMEFEVED